jgi:short-subunit dehydrogenase involved in D-alanine esterification of teichoic acids
MGDRSGTCDRNLLAKPDVADTAQLDLLLAEVDSNVAAVNLLINSAGVVVPKSFVGKSIATNQDAESSNC